MKKLFPYFLILPLVYFVLAFNRQNHEIRSLRKENENLQEQLTRQKVETAKASTAISQLTVKTEAFSEESDVLREKIASIDAPSAPPAEPTPAAKETAPKNPFTGMLEKMLKNPLARKAMMSQQLTVLKPMYADLIKQLGLNPEQSEQFFQLLAEQNSMALEAGLDANKADPQKLTDSLAASDAAFKELLGEEGYQNYQTYQRTIPDRASLTQIAAQMSAQNIPLRPDQSSGLLQIMQQEPLNTSRFAGAVSTNTPGTFPDADVLDITFQAQEERNERILARSKTLLTPQQWEAFAQQQQQSLAMQKMGIEMARGMFSDDNK